MIEGKQLTSLDRMMTSLETISHMCPPTIDAGVAMRWTISISSSLAYQLNSIILMVDCIYYIPNLQVRLITPRSSLNFGNFLEIFYLVCF